ncbi:uncharacterized protein LDX57_010487 [Aspergillus melleus]|uniref:uncharacterized protein n=1 Tax=Aspergillus melleus TaxID=138277 RepID=UPI001E8CC931|nr:uncharacterized protein LDX57_010487 [Aspergillus melleus]KAH8432857.1 hypothetical protein LDX57_010487 [Aspergillus melleus]
MDNKQDLSPSHSHHEEVLYKPDCHEVANAAMPDILRVLTPEEYKKTGFRATLKMDVMIFPCLMLMYILNYLDRNNIGAAKHANITEDLHLSSTEYQSCISVLFAGYTVYICAAMGIWGVISACQAAVHNFAGLMVARFLIGFVEAVFFPGALYYLSVFYNNMPFGQRCSTRARSWVMPLGAYSQSAFSS